MTTIRALDFVEQVHVTELWNHDGFYLGAATEIDKKVSGVLPQVSHLSSSAGRCGFRN